MQGIADSFECVLNRPGDLMPYAYYNPQTEGKLTWMCAEDAEGRITSVFCFDHGTHKEKEPSYLQDAAQAKYVRDELIAHGWQPLKPPEVTFKFPGEKDPRKMNRKEKRALGKHITKQDKKNPFKQ